MQAHSWLALEKKKKPSTQCNREGLLRAAEDRSQELVRNAESHSQEVARRAEAHAEQMKTEADGYVAETLRALRDHLSSIEMEVSRTILSIEKGLESLELPPEEEQDAQEGYEVFEGIQDMQSIQGAQAQSRTIPRRASLAVDTMGGPMYDQDSTPWVINPHEQAMDDNDPRNAPPKRGRSYE